MSATTRQNFAQRFLLPALGVRYDPSRIGARRFLAGTWPHAETGENPGLCNGVPRQGARWNPFNTTLPMPHSTLYNELSPGFGVRNYATATDGAQAFAMTLTNTKNPDGTLMYGEFLRLLRKRFVTRKQLIAALDKTNWGTHEPLLSAADGAYMANRGFYNSYPIGA